jgi:chromate transporter
MNAPEQPASPDPSEDSAGLPAASAPEPSYSLSAIALYFLKLGSLGFGGPVALVGFMHRDLVERRKWITESDYKEGVALAQLAPGPLAAQLAIYLGFVHYRLLGATVAGLAFVLPSFLMVVGLGWAYVAFGGLDWMQAVFYGVGPCVIAIITNSAIKLTRRTIGWDKLLWAIYLVSAACTVITESEIIWLFLGAGFLVWAVRTPPAWLSGRTLALAPLASLWDTVPVASDETLWRILWFFTKAGAFVFGSGLAIVPFLYSGVVKEYGWLNDQCGRGRDDYAWACRDHGGVHWLHRRRVRRLLYRCGRHVLAVLLLHRDPGAVPQEVRTPARHQGVRRWRDSRSDRRDRRRSRRPRPAHRSLTTGNPRFPKSFPCSRS